MQGPTTGSSIIHAATMVAAGVYLVARIHPLLTPGALFFVAIIGGITAFMAATMALVQWDIKAVLAYSTISQLGYMMVGLGSGAYTAGVAHLFTHAIFKCMLFLCAGSVIHACHHLQDMNRLGGLRKKMPITHLATLFGTLAITGVPFFSGFFSKDAILAGSLAAALEHGGKFWIPTVLAFLTAGLTAFYMFRLLFMTFYGKPRDAHIHEGAHESPALATIPLIVLSVFCLGFWWSGHIIAHTGAVPGVTMQVSTLEPAAEHSTHAARTAPHNDNDVKTEIKTQGWLETLMVSPTHQANVNKIAHSAHEFQHHEHLHHTAHLWATLVSLLMLSIGAGIAYIMYIKVSVTPETLLQIAPLRMLYQLFSQLWFIDRLYQDGIVPFCKRLNAELYYFDKNILDGFFVDGWASILCTWASIAGFIDNWIVDKIVDAFGWTTWILGAFTRCLQVGKIQFYVCLTFGAVALALLGLMLSV
jgi:NADH-quinone oxidoreductase subunit L